MLTNWIKLNWKSMLQSVRRRRVTEIVYTHPQPLHNWLRATMFLGAYMFITILAVTKHGTHNPILCNAMFAIFVIVYPALPQSPSSKFAGQNRPENLRRYHRLSRAEGLRIVNHGLFSPSSQILVEEISTHTGDAVDQRSSTVLSPREQYRSAQRSRQWCRFRSNRSLQIQC